MSVAVVSPLSGIVAEVLVPDGRAVAADEPVLLLESMKMHHEVTAPVAGVVQRLSVAVGEQVVEGAPLFALEPGAGAAEAAPEVADAPGTTAERIDLATVLDRRRRVLDDARPEAVAKRHALGRRTARENLADLCDDGSFSEYGGLALAAQRARRSLEELVEQTPGDGMVCGIARVGGVECAVLSYDYTVLAGTQGVRNHKKTDRLLELAGRMRLPVVLFAEGGGGRPGDSETSDLFSLVVPTFRTFAGLSGLVPRIGVASGRCFAGNAALLGCCDLVVATPDASIGMGGPAMIEGGGLGRHRPEDVGPAPVQVANGVIDVLAADEADAVGVARQLVGLLSGSVSAAWDCADQSLLRDVVPEDRQRVHDVRRLLELLADAGSVLELRPSFGRTILTALARIEGRPVGVVANDPRVLSGAIDAEGSDKAARFLQLCDAFGLPVISLVDTPGFMVGPENEETAMVRRCSRLFVAAATMTVPLVMVCVRRAFGLGAQAMAGGDFHAPVLNIAWPTGEFGAMGVEGAVRPALRRELEAIADEAEREARVRELVEQVRGESGALNMAAFFEIDDVIDPADTRARVTAALAACPPPAPGRRRTMVDTW